MSMALTAMVLIATKQSADPVIDLEFGGVRLPELVEHLSKESGETLLVSRELSKEVVAVYGKGMRLSDVKAKLADVTYGSWVERSGGLTLASDPDRIRRMDTELGRRRLEAVRAAKTAIRNSMSGRSGGEEEGEQLDFSTPEGKAWATVALQIPDSGYVNLQKGERVVFSTRPTQVQRGIQAGALPGLVDEWIVGHNKRVEQTTAQFQDASQGGGEEAAMLQMLGQMFGGNFMPRKVESAPAKVLGILTASDDWGRKGSEGASPMLQVKVIDATGKELVSEMQMLGGGNAFSGLLEQFGRLSRGDEEEATGEAGDDFVIELPKEVALYRSALNPMSAQIGEALAERSPEALAMLTDPVAHEPLSYLAGVPMVAYAKKKEKGLVALLDDATAMSAFGGTRESVRASQVERLFGLGEDVLEDGFYVVRPDDPVKVRTERVSRDDLGELLRMRATDLAVSLDIMASFASRNPGSEQNGVYRLTQSAVVPDMDEMLGASNSWSSLVFWGNLSAGQRAALRQGDQVALSALSANARNWLAGEIYNGRVALGAVASMVRKPLWERFGDLGVMGTGMFGGSTLTNEPTEMLPNGLPRDGYLASQVTNETYFVQVGKNGEPVALSVPMGVNEIAFAKQMFSVMSPEMSQGVSINSFDRLARGERTAIDVGVFVAPETGAVFNMMDQRAPDKSRTFTMENLPADVAAQLADADAKIKASPMMQLMQTMMRFGGGMNRGGGTARP